MATTNSPPPLPPCRRTPIRVLQSWPRTRIVRDEPGVLAVEWRSRIFRFVEEMRRRYDEP